MDESKNIYVSSRGLLKSCDIHSQKPHSSIKAVYNTNFKMVKNNDQIPTIYICSSAIPDFIENFLFTIDYKFILVSGDCDETIPNDIFKNYQDFESFIENEKIVHWYCQNMIIKHKKMTQMPIGMDYHTMTCRTMWGPLTSCENQEKLLSMLKQKSLPWSERKLVCYCNYHFTMNTKYGKDRKMAYSNVPVELCVFEIKKVPRLKSWNNQINCAFVISPHGNGLDCHRTWEALLLGCIPIVRSSKLDSLYDELPVLIVKNWSDVTKELLHETIEKFNKMSFNYDKLTLKYWTDKIKSTNEDSV